MMNEPVAGEHEFEALGTPHERDPTGASSRARGSTTTITAGNECVLTEGGGSGLLTVGWLAFWLHTRSGPPGLGRGERLSRQPG